MEEEIKGITDTTPAIKSSSAAAPQISYSAKELAEMYMASRVDFMGLDLEVVTLNWNLNFIYDFLYCVRDIEAIDSISQWLVYSWVDKHHLEDTYDNQNNKELNEECSRFAAALKDIKRKLLQRFENERNKQSLVAKMLEGYHHNKMTTTTAKKASAPSESIHTNSPEFTQQTLTKSQDGDTPSPILIENLPKNVQKIILVSQSVFDVFVKQLNEDAWLIVEQEKGKYCDALRFLCNFYHITSRDTSREEFDDLLHAVVEAVKGKGSLVSSMGRCKYTTTKTISSSYKYYASPVHEHRKKIWQLINDCEPLEESLKPVIEAMKQEEMAATQNNQG
jgi:hypothetical protein